MQKINSQTQLRQSPILNPQRSIFRLNRINANVSKMLKKLPVILDNLYTVPKTITNILVFADIIKSLQNKQKQHCFYKFKHYIYVIGQQKSVISYRNTTFEDQAIHSILKIYETKQKQNIIWAFLNIRFLVNIRLLLFLDKLCSITNKIIKNKIRNGLMQIEIYSSKQKKINKAKSQSIHSNSIRKPGSIYTNHHKFNNRNKDSQLQRTDKSKQWGPYEQYYKNKSKIYITPYENYHPIQKLQNYDDYYQDNNNRHHQYHYQNHQAVVFPYSNINSSCNTLFHYHIILPKQNYISCQNKHYSSRYSEANHRRSCSLEQFWH